VGVKLRNEPNFMHAGLCFVKTEAKNGPKFGAFNMWKDNEYSTVGGRFGCAQRRLRPLLDPRIRFRARHGRLGSRRLGSAATKWD
jgi:hypothetical protein